MAKFCKECGNKLSADAKFCGKCGSSIIMDRKTEDDNKVEDETVRTTQVKSSFSKSRIVAGVLGILLGAYGVHNFYLGYTGKGIAQILITVLSCGFFSWISYIWGLIEGIQILTGSINEDAYGNKLSD